MPNVKDKMTGNVVKSKFQPKCIHLQDRIPGAPRAPAWDHLSVVWGFCPP